MKKLLYFTFVLFIGSVQSQDFSGVIESYFSNYRTTHNLQQQDVSDFTIRSQHFSKSTSVHHIYVHQRFQGIEIFNSITNFTIKNNEILSVKNGFINNISSKINALQPSISPFDAIQNAASKLGIGTANGVQQLENLNTNIYLFSKGNISQENISVKLVFQPLDEFTKLHLAWDLNIYTVDGKHWYSIRVDAQSGDVLEIHDWVNECNFNYEVDDILFSAETQHFLFQSAPSLQDGSQYRVLPMPVESPNHGSLSLEIEPATGNASPFGWHDTDGISGPEYTVTRGNNVRARADLLGNNSGESPNGGMNLNFDFPYNFNAPSFVNTEAVTVNLFYWNNILHDVWYNYGFDEPSGNFQENNYGNGGAGNDSVNADAQDSSGTNNANFATPPDGMNPRMQMYLWNSQGPVVDPLTINTGTVAGSYQVVKANFGAQLPYINPITADLVLVEDDNNNAEGCGNITNSANINGKIAVLRRGTCQF
ncbi:MAG TPA: M36 family metallopeptidase, partial [Flavobacteriaceae bacterium]|nr:M36 family metallopeptidase [Flavobacteriaceae bacterium]